jgi:hypothetical protein
MIARTLVVDVDGTITATHCKSKSQVDYCHRQRTIYWNGWADSAPYIIWDPNLKRLRGYKSRENACKGIDRILGKLEGSLVRLALP